MQETIIRNAIRFFGNITTMSSKLGISRASIYRYLEGSPIPSHIALRIEAKSKKKFRYRELIPWKAKYHLDLDIFPDSLVELPLKKIIIPENIANFPDKKNLTLANHRAICVDENAHLIYGLETIEAAKKRRKKSVLAWRLSMDALRNRKYEVHHLIKAFDPFERVAIGIILEKLIGNRQGKRTDLDELVDNYPQVQGIKTRNLVAEVLGFGSDYIYRQLKKILRQASSTLIDHVRNKKISISKAAEIVECLYLKGKKKGVNYEDSKSKKIISSIDLL